MMGRSLGILSILGFALDAAANAKEAQDVKVYFALNPNTHTCNRNIR